jgi:hypothetical protein
MQQPTTLFVVLDVHKDSISVAYAENQRNAPPQFVGAIGTAPRDMDKLIRRLHSKASHLVFAYEAGPCGYINASAQARAPSRVACSALLGKSPDDLVMFDGLIIADHHPLNLLGDDRVLRIRSGKSANRLD